ncbi:MAG: hypothetical protein M1820_010907 [Bogoriella megaspora]|nr:MAG: hypothetical protein M1820_010907 [Bogoriella megaspora]
MARETNYLVDVDGNAVSEWYKVRGQDCLDCNGTSECTIKKDESVSLCTSVTFSQEVSIGFDAVKSAISASMSVSTAYTEQQCNSTTMGIECKWDDDLQHSVWAQNQLTRIYGYTRRRCNFKKDDKGDVTVWSKDYIIDTPNGSVNTGCSALCEATQYPA